MKLHTNKARIDAFLYKELKLRDCDEGLLRLGENNQIIENFQMLDKNSMEN